MAEKTWTDISDAVLTAENPITQTTARQLRDNAEYARDRALYFEDVQEDVTLSGPHTFTISTPGKDWVAGDKLICYFALQLNYDGSAPYEAAAPDFPVQEVPSGYSYSRNTAATINFDSGGSIREPTIQIIGPVTVDDSTPVKILDLDITNTFSATVDVTFLIVAGELTYTVAPTGSARVYGCRMIVKEIFLD